ncbi:MAG: PAS domain-containing protein [Acidobacteria bacterium]|nr:PAS domain-containing protein [Acidobacteriota bacterium]
MSSGAAALLGLTAIVGALCGLLMFAAMRFMSAAGGRQRSARAADQQASTLSAALEDAIAQLRAKERAMAARAEESERLSSEIISSLASGLIVVASDGATRIINPVARRLLELGDEALRGDYHTLLDEPALSQTIDECLANGKAILRRTVDLPEGRRRASRFGVTVSPLFDASGHLHGAVCLFTDLTAVQQLEEQLRLKQSLATVGELTAGIAHEFRNGLATIHGYSKLLNPDTLPEQARPYVEGIRAEAVALGEIVTNFLNFARPAQLALTDIDLGTLCARVVDDARDEARKLGGEVSLIGEFGLIQGDEVLLRQAFSNLLRNAIEACAGASIAPSVQVHGLLDTTAGTCTVTVDDNGPGIPPNARERIFQPFFTSKGHGTGLGLALVQKIVVSHNGRISVATSPGGGARLQVVLPIL